MEYTQDELEFMLGAALAQSDAYPKALANFLFREVIEDAHTKYNLGKMSPPLRQWGHLATLNDGASPLLNISQEDMKDMCKKAVNRAALYIALQHSERPTTMQAFAIHSISCNEWDDSEITEDIEREMDLIADCEKVLKQNNNKKK